MIKALIQFFMGKKLKYRNKQSFTIALQEYTRLSQNLLSKEGLQNLLILKHAQRSLAEGHTPQETVLQSYLFDLALKVQQNKDDLSFLIENVASIIPHLQIFKEWKDEKSLDKSIWEEHTTAIYRLSCVDEQQMAWLELDPEMDNTKFCIKANAAFMRRVLGNYGTSLKDADDDDIFTAGLFVFTISNYLAQLQNVMFETVANNTFLEIFIETHHHEKLIQYIDLLIKYYNHTAKNSKIILAITQNVDKWFTNPEPVQLDKIVELYGLCRSHIVEVSG